MGWSTYRRVLGVAGLPLLAVAVVVGVVVLIARYSDSAPAPTPAPTTMSTPASTNTPTNAPPTRVSTTLPTIAWPGGPREWSTRSGVEYSKADLDAWHKELADAVGRIPGYSGSGVDESENRIDISMYGRRGAREAVEAAIARANVPREAVVIRFGCGPFRPEQPPSEAFLRAIDFSLDMASQVSYGQTVRMKLTLRNVSDEPVVLFRGDPPHDFVVTTPDGEGVWYWTCGKFLLAVGITDTMKPGATRVFTGSWEQVSNHGEAVSPGTYIVHAAFNYAWGDSTEFVQLVTAPHRLEVLSE